MSDLHITFTDQDNSVHRVAIVPDEHGPTYYIRTTVQEENGVIRANIPPYSLDGAEETRAFLIDYINDNSTADEKLRDLFGKG